jgi:hypothetical protein
MKKRRHLILLPAVLLIVAGVSGGAVEGKDPAPGVEPEADRILREMSEYLSSLEQFTIHAEIANDSVGSDGETLEFGGAAKASIRRPNRLRVEYRGDQRQSSVVFDGRTLTLHKLDVNLYAQTKMATDVDGALDRMFEEFGFSVPVADLVYEDPYATLTGAVETGYRVGLRRIDGVPCHHLAFTQETIDWQIWIEDGPRPLPRKLLIIYKNEPGAPRYAARLPAWDLQPRLSDAYFRFHPPPGADDIDFLPSQDEETAP